MAYSGLLILMAIMYTSYSRKSFLPFVPKLPDRQQCETAGDSFLYFMAKKTIIKFLLSTILLMVSEYFLLQELFSYRRISVIMGSATGFIIAALFFIFFFSKYRKASKDF